MVERFLHDGDIVFDERVVVMAPANAEDSLNVPVSVSVNDLSGIEEIFVFSDLNPISEILRFYPMQSKPYIAFRLKLQQGSPVRAAARTSDGVWHVGGVWVNTTGGGCTSPSMGTSTGSWTDSLGKVQARRWQRDNGIERLRIEIMHPMDTGLASGIPPFYIEKMEFTSADGEVLARLETYEPVSENPVLSMDLQTNGSSDVLSISGLDNNGNRINARIAQ